MTFRIFIWVQRFILFIFQSICLRKERETHMKIIYLLVYNNLLLEFEITERNSLKNNKVVG